jgi:hypothetical protein
VSGRHARAEHGRRSRGHRGRARHDARSSRSRRGDDLGDGRSPARPHVTRARVVEAAALGRGRQPRLSAW